MSNTDDPDTVASLDNIQDALVRLMDLHGRGFDGVIDAISHSEGTLAGFPAFKLIEAIEGVSSQLSYLCCTLDQIIDEDKDGNHHIRIRDGSE